MGVAANGFLAGFFQKTSENIDERKDEAKEYFNRQMELARTKGMAARDKRASEMTGAVSQAKQLQQIGVPKDIVISIAKQNPADLAVFAEQMQDLKAKGVPVDEDFFRSVIKVQGETGSNESIEDTLKRIYMPLKQAAEADPEAVAADPQTSIWGAMMGYNAMDRARSRLGSEEVIDGLTAEDLLRLSSSDINTDPNTVVTLDASVAGDAARAAKASMEGGEKPNYQSASEIAAQKKAFDEALEAARVDWGNKQAEAGNTEGAYAGWKYDPNYTPEVENQLRLDVFDKVAQDFEANDIPLLPSVREQFLEGPVEGSTEASEEGASGTPETASSPSEAPPEVAPAKPGTIYRGLVLVKDNGDGTALWRSADGKTYQVPNNDAPERLGLSRTGN